MDIFDESGLPSLPLCCVYGANFKYSTKTHAKVELHSNDFFGFANKAFDTIWQYEAMARAVASKLGRISSCGVRLKAIAKCSHAEYELLRISS